MCRNSSQSVKSVPSSAGSANSEIPSSAAFGKIGEAYVQAVHDFAKAHHIPLVHFQKGQNKEKFARPFLQAAAQEGKDRVVLIGIAQEKASACTTVQPPGTRLVRRLFLRSHDTEPTGPLQLLRFVEARGVWLVRQRAFLFVSSSTAMLEVFDAALPFAVSPLDPPESHFCSTRATLHSLTP